jgi:hypothetical protein
MDFEELRRIPLGEAASAIVTEGGATVGGFIGAGVLGRRIQAMVKSDAEVVTTVDKLYAWAANNGPKIAAWYFLRGRPVLGTASADFNKGVVTSVAFDTLMRLLHEGKNPSAATVMGYEVLGESGTVNAADSTVQRLVQENAGLRAELGRLKGTGQQVQQVAYQEGPYSPRLPPYVGSQQVIPPAERERKFAFMQPAIPGLPRPPGVAERERKYGFAGEVSAMSAKGKPGAAYVQAGKMFGMQ